MSSIEFEYNSDILEVDNTQIIAQQCNCKSKTCKGLSEDIANKYPYADFYSTRKEDSNPGTIKVVGSPKKGERYVCAMFAQLNPGKPKKGDTSSQREGWFKECLGRISLKKGVKSVAFPYKIGCGLAGGNWVAYSSMIEKWAEENPNIKVKIISQNNEAEKKEDHTCKEERMSNKDINTLLFEHRKYVTEKIKFLTIPQKARLLDHLFHDIKADVISSSHKVIDEISSSEGVNNDFYRWAWEELERTSPFLDINYFVKLYSERNNTCRKETTQEKEEEPEDEPHSEEESEGEDVPEEDVSEDVPEESEEEEPEEEISWNDMSLIEYTRSGIPEGWELFFEDILENDGLKDVSKLIFKDSKKHELYPPINEVYTAFELCPVDEVKVVIIGQDPYHTPGAAMGLAFGHHNDRTKLQPSLRNIYKCLENDGFSVNRSSGDLSTWAAQGVFLINTALTVRKGEAGSHASKSKSQEGPWDYFIRQLFSHLNENCDHLVVVLWGLKAQAYEPLFSKDKHFHIKAPHPASYNDSIKDFFEHKPFSRTNKQLGKWGKNPIDWNLVEEDESEEE